MSEVKKSGPYPAKVLDWILMWFVISQLSRLRMLEEFGLMKFLVHGTILSLREMCSDKLSSWFATLKIFVRCRSDRELIAKGWWVELLRSSGQLRQFVYLFSLFAQSTRFPIIKSYLENCYSILTASHPISRILCSICLIFFKSLAFWEYWLCAIH